MAIKSVVGHEFLFIEAMADHTVIDDVIRQVRHPARHQVEHCGARRNLLAIKLRQTPPKGLVQMMNETRLSIKKHVIVLIELGTLIVSKNLNRQGDCEAMLSLACYKPFRESITSRPHKIQLS